MRLFKRPSTSPQLVSATPIPQDGASIANTEEKIESIEEPSTNVKIVQRPPKSENEPHVANEVAIAATSSSFSTRKGISTWGRKVGRRWDQLKRSDSSELLSVSGRRRRWSPNRKSLGETTDGPDKCRMETPSSSEFVKPKRISRVESLRNLFRTCERPATHNVNGETLKRGATIVEEEHDYSGDSSHCRMEKALSEGALRTSSRLSAEVRHESLAERKRQLTESIQNLQEQQRVFDYILNNREIMKSQEGLSFVRQTLDRARPSVNNGDTYGEYEKSGNHEHTDANRATNRIRDRCKTASNVKRILFNNGNNERIDQRRSLNGSALEDLMCTLRLGCDESGYDSDSTRTGADSPDSEQASATMLKRRSFSITSDDYQGIDLSIPMSTPKKKNPTAEIAKKLEEVPIADNNVIDNDNEKNQNKDNDNIEDMGGMADGEFDESMKTDTTLMSEDEGDDDEDHDEDDDTDSCDENTFPELRFTPCCHTRIEIPVNNDQQSKTKSLDPTVTKTSEEVTYFDRNIYGTPTKRVNVVKEDKMSLAQRVRLENLRKGTRTRMATKGRKISNASLLNLLENASSPCKDSPPASKLSSQVPLDCLHYYSPKRSRSKMEADGTEVTHRKPVKRPVFSPSTVPPSAPAVCSLSKSLVRRELKTMKLQVEKAGNLGIRVEKQEAVRPYYIVSKLDENGEAAKSKQIRVGDEVVRVCGRRLRGMSTIEARNALKNSIGTVELQIAREPTFNLDGELGDTWGEVVSRTRSDSEIWGIEETPTNQPIELTHDTCQFSQNRPDRCEIVGALTKSGKSVSMNTMNTAGRDYDDSGLKITGMRKFQVVRKRNSVPAARSRRTTSLTMDLLTVTLEKGATKKLGFSIVGGSDSNKGNMGIFVKDVMNGGQAAEEGTLRAGDEILAINGQLMEGLSHAKALQFFKAAKPGKLILHVGRRDPTHKRFHGHSKSYDCLAKLSECGEE